LCQKVNRRGMSGTSVGKGGGVETYADEVPMLGRLMKRKKIGKLGRRVYEVGGAPSKGKARTGGGGGGRQSTTGPYRKKGVRDRLKTVR